jgi:AcrR family transcriptional regulator
MLTEQSGDRTILASMSQRISQPKRANGRVVLPRLRSGPNGLPAYEVRAIQRARILDAMAEVAGERGVALATVASVIARARISRRTFYQQFRDRHDCLLGLFDDTVQRAEAAMGDAGAAEGAWADGIRASLQALLAFIDEEPQLCGLCLAQWLSGEHPPLRERREWLMGVMASAVDAGRGAGAESPALTAEAVVGAVISIVHSRLQAEPPTPVSALLPALMAVIVLPYLGAAAARRELARPLPPARPRSSARERSTAPELLAQLNTRITYRTLCVISLVGAQPGLSNREVAEAAGVTDPGQISRLLSRLRGLELMENRGPGRSAGGQNSWVLTDSGEELWRASGLAGEPAQTGRRCPPSATALASSAPRNGVSAK